MDSLVERITSIAPVWMHVVVGALVFAEESMIFGLLVPGDTAALLAGVVAGQWHAGLPMTLVLVIVAAIAGASVGYGFGRHYGTRMLRWAMFDRYRDKLDRTGQFLERHGNWAIVFGRFSTFFRTMLPHLVGMSPISYGRFLIVTTVGAILWGSTLVTAGYFAGQSITALARQVDSVLAIIVPVVALAAFGYWKWRQRRSAALPPPATP
ncbi:DedA family protein [Nocardia jejuensis]|uniref:DedA family protein n=1 Tax=Nocardia jejuensis TaxID=328049 RepID=UPI00082A5C6B|nr:DedA family protein [Nocardia jejuensis]